MERTTKNQDSLVTTSIRVRRSTRTAAKLFAIRHDMTMQELIEAAILRYIDDNAQEESER